MERSATHAGSWYQASPPRLKQELEDYLIAVRPTEDYPKQNTRAIIVPHAGFRYSGPTAAYAYKCVDVAPIKRIFILGPSHHFPFRGCCVSPFDFIGTPFGRLVVDKQVAQTLVEKEGFGTVAKRADEREHSLEMQFPFIHKIFADKINEVKVVPIMVGSMDASSEKKAGEALAPYLADPSNLFVISSDFCHWGERFDYYYYFPAANAAPFELEHNEDIQRPVSDSIRELDHQGMAFIERLDLDGFTRYIQKTHNTICGRRPIGVLLATVKALQEQQPHCKQDLKFVKYAQSNAVQHLGESSVSYASAYLSIDISE
ncbi:cell motility mediator [Radiomyces spectabilis]|uniref:cell motility mediator n=1 Tax=Radiomyces spectabilis TaxID=64574 RepID=UPI00221F4F1F|nr:cell motility mediator [Radiomyces spectabilis]KAI8374614.1 cell motility mediator [Radiomyces spectabilis]